MMVPQFSKLQLFSFPTSHKKDGIKHNTTQHIITQPTTTNPISTTMTATTNTKENIDLECDYLIVGAGASTLAFLDTLMTELPDAKIILIDKKAAPGGHWIDSYGYVQLHQPSIVYGIASKQLEGNWLNCMLTQFMLPWNHRANKTEILKYFADFVKENKEQVDFYSDSVYDFEKSDEDTHFFSSIDGSVSYKVQVNVKLIDGSSNENIVPHSK
jgi:hypothetical protein